MKKTLTVSEINAYIKKIISADMQLANVSVKGEISNFKHHYSGHMYFTLKDKGGVIRCVMFRSNASRVEMKPEDGMCVVIHGYVSVFEKAGQYQLYVLDMAEDGKGSLHEAFEKLKKELQEKGLFDREKKKPLPYIPTTICVITSSTGAVIRDIINVIFRRFPNVHVRLIPAAVQGTSAAREIAEAVRLANTLKIGDVIIVARGGGSLEELWPFNERIVAEGIYESDIPVISAVGHETDFTIADFVADVRAPTPSAAAELVVPEKKALEIQVKKMEKRLENAMLKNVHAKRATFERLEYSAVFRQPLNRVYQERMNIDILLKGLSRAIKSCIDKEKSRLSVAAGRLDVINPLKTIARGYGAVNNTEDGRFVKSVRDLKEGDDIRVTLADGSAGCTVKKVKKGDYLITGV